MVFMPGARKRPAWHPQCSPVVGSTDLGDVGGHPLCGPWQRASPLLLVSLGVCGARPSAGQMRGEGGYLSKHHTRTPVEHSLTTDLPLLRSVLVVGRDVFPKCLLSKGSSEERWRRYAYPRSPVVLLRRVRGSGLVEAEPLL